MSYNSFLKVVLTCEDPPLKNSVLRRPYHRIGRFDYMPLHLESKLAELFMSEIEFLRRVESLIKLLQGQADFTLQAAFRLVDRRNEDALNEHNLSDFFRAHGLYLVQRELLSIIRRLDLDGAAKISFKEFQKFFRCFSRKIEPFNG